MKYKNITKELLVFRAHNKNGEKKLFLLREGEEMESDREVNLGGLELVKTITKEVPKTTKLVDKKKESDK